MLEPALARSLAHAQPYFTFIKLLRHMLHALELQDVVVSRIEGLVLADDRMEALKQQCAILASPHAPLPMSLPRNDLVAHVT